jgi:hypothetical protein
MEEWATRRGRQRELDAIIGSEACTTEIVPASWGRTTSSLSNVRPQASVVADAVIVDETALTDDVRPRVQAARRHWQESSNSAYVSVMPLDQPPDLYARIFFSFSRCPQRKLDSEPCVAEIHVDAAPQPQPSMEQLTQGAVAVLLLHSAIQLSCEM